MQEVTLHLEQNTDFHIKEAFKTLRSNVEFCGSDVKVVAVTSCTPHEGKTSVAMEMAKAFAEAGNKTLLIDADMRKSVLVGRYKTGAVKYGLSHCLVGNTGIRTPCARPTFHAFICSFPARCRPIPANCWAVTGLWIC